MILQQLYHDAGAILGEELAPPMYDWKPVRWLVRLHEDGRLIGYQSLGGDKDNKYGLRRLVPYVGKTSGIRPTLIVDKPAYSLGLTLKDTEKRADRMHEAFKALVKRCAEETGDSDVKAVDVFLSQHDPAVPLPAEAAAMTAADLVTFQVGDNTPTDNPDVQAFWAKSAKPEPEKGANIAECLVTGQIGPVESSLPGLIKRIPGGQSAGVALVSANAAAFESHGWERAQTSPISREAAERFTKALNRLIEDERTHITIGGLVYVFWTKSGGDPSMAMALDRPDDSQVRDALQAAWTGKQSRVLRTDAFHALAVSASGGRAVVRDWLTTTVGHAYDNLKHWFDVQKMVMPDGTDGQPLGIYRLAGSAYRDRKDMEPAVLQSLIRAALHQEAVPRSLLSKAVMRCRVGTKNLQGDTIHVTRAQAALIKACLLTAPSEDDTRKEQLIPMSGLDPHQTEPAYVCGRLLAELEAVQRASAYPRKLNATLTDRYFGAASTAPATVFGVLLTQANKAHLPDLRKNNPRAYQSLQRRMEEILDLLDASSGSPFPNSLPLRDQAWFSLGFYHQRAADHKARLDAAARIAAGKATALDEEIAAQPDPDAATDDTEPTEE